MHLLPLRPIECARGPQPSMPAGYGDGAQLLACRRVKVVRYGSMPMSGHSIRDEVSWEWKCSSLVVMPSMRALIKLTGFSTGSADWFQWNVYVLH